MDKYKNRIEAGLILSAHLMHYHHKENTLILALPRGGVPIAYEIAKKLDLPFDIFIVRKLGLPHYEELAMGALASGDMIAWNEAILTHYSVEEEAVKNVIEKERQELKRREKVYRQGKPFPNLKQKTIILVDDGIATGATMRAAILAIKTKQPKEIVIAIPVADNAIIKELKNENVSVICPLRPQHLNAVGAWYEEFNQVTDQEVTELLTKQIST